MKALLKRAMVASVVGGALYFAIKAGMLPDVKEK